MKEQKADMDIDDLFRKLEGAGPDPSPAAGRLLMKKLAVREFLRFNPSRFNIYYAGLVALFTAAALYVMLSSGTVSEPDDGPELPSVIDKADTLVIQGGMAIPLPQQADQSRSTTFQASSGTGVVSGSDRKGTRPKKERNIKDRHEYGLTEILENRVLTSPALYISDSSAKGLRSGSPQGPSIEASVSSGCAPLKVKFSTGNADFSSCSWSFGDGGTSVEPDPVWIFSTEGEFTVVLTLFLNDGTERTESVLISVYGKPNAFFEILPLKPVIPDDEISFVNYSSGAVTYRWDFGDGGNSGLFAPVYRYRSFGTYDVTMIAISEKGCSDTLVIKDAFGENGYFIDFPNAFIPNTGGPSDGRYSRSSDEMAHIFHPVYSGVTEYDLKIFSKTGILVFETNDIHTGWDGYYKGHLSSPGVYVWKVSGAFANGEPFFRTGDLIIIRNGN